MDLTTLISVTIGILARDLVIWLKQELPKILAALTK
jgi:hypothetical protein